MPSLLDLRRRIKSVKNTQKITRAMQLVAASKMKKAQDAALGSRPYAEELMKLISNLVEHAGDTLDHAYFEKRKVKKVAYILFTADRGLCGAFNTNLIRHIAKKQGEDMTVIAVGRKGAQFIRSTQICSMDAEFEQLGDNPQFVECTAVARVAVDGFLQGDWDEVRLVYGHFVNTMTQVVTERTLLPLSRSSMVDQESHETHADYLFEPSVSAVLDTLLPRYVEIQVWQSLLESNASEQSARMIAMKSATDNAKELGKSLTLEMNKARQAAITTEISEIVGGAAALQG